MATTDESILGKPGLAREPHAVVGPALTFDLAAEGEALKREAPWQTHGHNAKTLIKHPDFRTVLIALKTGAHFPTHKPDQCLTIQALTGRLRMQLAGQTIELTQGQLLALGQTGIHDIEAVEESVFLLSLGWTTKT
jgi:quercetin dioxygenase-like cupin family protein